MNANTDRPPDPTRHFDITLQDGSFFAAVEGANELDAAEWLGAQLGQDIAHLLHDTTPVLESCSMHRDRALRQIEGVAA